jgi:hypothetical protein
MSLPAAGERDAAGVALSGCGGSAPVDPSTVSTVRAPTYGQELYGKMRRHIRRREDGARVDSDPSADAVDFVG